MKVEKNIKIKTRLKADVCRRTGTNRKKRRDSIAYKKWLRYIGGRRRIKVLK